MLSLDDETCIEGGFCADLLPQFFELTEGGVRIRLREQGGPAEGASAGEERASDSRGR